MQIIKIADLVTNNPTIMIYGAPGSGKTTVLGELPGKTLIVDIDRGTSTIAGIKKDISVIRIDSVQDLFTLLEKLEKNCPFDNICIDSLSELQKIMLTELGRNGKNNSVPEMGHYQRVDFEITDLCRRFRNIGKVFVMTAWELVDEVVDDTGVKYPRSKPLLSGKTIAETVCGLCETVGRLCVNQEDERRIVFTSRQSMYGKDRVLKRKFCKPEELIQTKEK